MSDQIIHAPVRAGGADLSSFIRRAIRRLVLSAKRRRSARASDLCERDRADLGLRNHDSWRTDPRPPSYFGPNGR